MSKVVRAPDGSPWRAILTVLFALVYGVSPLDVIPDVLPLVGWADDAVVIPLMLLLALLQLRRGRRAATYASGR